MSSTDPITTPVDIACVIHSEGYDWIYVEKLYSMLERHCKRPFWLHVYTEPIRPVASPLVKHNLVEWAGVAGPRRSWWYKMQLFNPANHQGPLLYFDLDVIITRPIDWIWQLDLAHFWAAKDFRRIFRPNRQELNSSVMYWDTRQYSWVWEEFKKNNLMQIIRNFSGDQDFLNSVLPPDKLAFFDVAKVQSFRWEIKDGGLDPRKRTYRAPNSGAKLGSETSVIVFHGRPKPHEVQDFLINRLWNAELE